MASNGDGQKELWKKIWTEEISLMTSAEVPVLLKKFIESAENGRTCVKIFVPVCGNSYEIKWLADRGHTVVGVEFIADALAAFFTAHSIAYTTEPSTACKGTLFKSKDGKIRLYCCDLLDFNSDVEGQFDAIYDTHSLGVLPKDSRQCGAAVLVSLMGTDCRYLLDTYDSKEGGDPGRGYGCQHPHPIPSDRHHSTGCHHGHEPHDGEGHHCGHVHHHDDDEPCTFSEAQVKKYYGDKCDITKLFDKDAHDTWKELIDTGDLPYYMKEMPPSQQKLYLMTLKQ